MQRHQPLPVAALRARRDCVAQRPRRGDAFSKGGSEQDHRTIAVLTLIFSGEQRVELGPAGFFYAEKTQALLDLLKRQRGVGPVSAVQIEKTAHAKMAA